MPKQVMSKKEKKDRLYNPNISKLRNDEQNNKVKNKAPKEGIRHNYAARLVGRTAPRDKSRLYPYSD